MKDALHEIGIEGMTVLEVREPWPAEGTPSFTEAASTR